jgi:hypothetical protein
LNGGGGNGTRQRGRSPAGEALRTQWLAPLLLLPGLALNAPAVSAVIYDLDVTRHRGRYELVAHTFLDAPARGIFNVLTDYDDDAFGRISGVYEESGYVGADEDGTPLVYTLVRGCMVFFCRDLRRVSRLEVEVPTLIRTTALPARSDFKYSRSEWMLEPTDRGTEVTYRLVMEPDFWVPPFVGPLFLKKRFREGGRRALERIERLARGEPSAVELPAREAKPSTVERPAGGQPSDLERRAPGEATGLERQAR